MATNHRQPSGWAMQVWPMTRPSMSCPNRCPQNIATPRPHHVTPLPAHLIAPQFCDPPVVQPGFKRISLWVPPPSPGLQSGLRQHMRGCMQPAGPHRMRSTPGPSRVPPLPNHPHRHAVLPHARPIATNSNSAPLSTPSMHTHTKALGTQAANNRPHRETSAQQRNHARMAADAGARAAERILLAVERGRERSRAGRASPSQPAPPTTPSAPAAASTTASGPPPNPSASCWPPSSALPASPPGEGSQRSWVAGGAGWRVGLLQPPAGRLGLRSQVVAGPEPLWVGAPSGCHRLSET